jgi:hypothetical protein
LDLIERVYKVPSAALVSESAVLAILADPSPTRRWVVRFYSTKASFTYTDLFRCLASVRFTLIDATFPEPEGNLARNLVLFLARSGRNLET